MSHQYQQQQQYGMEYGYDNPGHHVGAEDYSYPPHNNGSSAEFYEKGGGTALEHRQESYSGSSYDEKAATLADSGTEYAKHPLSGDNNNDSVDDLPVPIPRHPDGGGSSRPTSQWQPGHVSRGSVALLAAAEGKIPKKEGLKMWRSDEHHGTFTRGGKRKTCLRCCGCTILLALVIIVGIIAAFLLWVRPPNVLFRGVLAPQDGSQELNVTSNGFTLNFDLDIAVSNPNFFGASFKSISAKAYYPTTTDEAIGGGSLSNVKIPAHSHNTLYFPFSINYTKSIDPNSVILQDIATKCGFIGDTVSDIKVNYDLTLRMKIVAFTISPTFSSSTSFACPLTLSDVEGLVSGTDLSGLLGGSS